MKINKLKTVLLSVALMVCVGCVSGCAELADIPLVSMKDVNIDNNPWGLTLIDTEALGHKTVDSIPILMYHHLAPNGTYTEKNNAIVTVENFAAQMAYLKKHNYTTLSFSEFLSHCYQGVPFKENSVVITFDDGYESNYVYAYPILKEYGFKACMNLVVKSTEKLEGSRSVDYVYQPKSTTHFTFDQMKEMADSGIVEFSTHTYDSHGEINIAPKGKCGPATINKRYFTKEDRYETDEQYLTRLTVDFAKSKKIIAEKTGFCSAMFVYPYGRYNDTVVNAVKNSSFLGAVTVKPGLAGLKSGIYQLPRVTVNADDTLDVFARKLSTGK